MFKIDVSDLERLAQAIAADEADIAQQQSFRRAFMTHVTLLTPMLRALCPKETGHMASSIRCTFTNGQGIIFIDTEYATYVINGTSALRPNDFVTTAHLATRADLLKRMATESFKNIRKL